MKRGRGAPDPAAGAIARVIAIRGAQTGGTALLALLGLRAALPGERLRTLVPWGGALVTAGLSAYFTATFVASVPLGAPVLTRLPAGAGDAVALTFDDGPHPDTTPRLLDILAAQDARATFFVLGEAASRHPHLVRRIRDEGHGIGIHGLRHQAMVLQSARAIEGDLREALRRIESAAPTPPGAPPVRLLRPPYGFKSVTLGRVATRLGLRLVAWSANPHDYNPITVDALLARARAHLRPGVIVLLHERPHASATLDALPHLLRFCKERGWRCVALDGRLSTARLPAA